MESLRFVVRCGTTRLQGSGSPHPLRGKAFGAVENEGSPPYSFPVASLLAWFLARQISAQWESLNAGQQDCGTPALRSLGRNNRRNLVGQRYAGRPEASGA